MIELIIWCIQAFLKLLILKDKMNTIQYILKHEKNIFITLLVFVGLSWLGLQPQHETTILVALLMIGIFGIMLIGIFNVVRHADVLAEKLGEPYGTLILTLSVIIIEVALIVTMTLVGKAELTLARDTMLSVIVIAINGFVGTALFAGGIRHQAQSYNLDGANAFLAVLIPLSIICLILPNYTPGGAMGQFSFFHALVVTALCTVLYITFLVMQTITHTDSFKMKNLRTQETIDAQHCSANSLIFHIIFLVLSLIGLILLSKQFSLYLDYSLQQLGLSKAVGGFLIALLILMPEGYSAVQAAYQNDVQRSVNLCLGSALATICLTVPAVLIISLWFHSPIVLGLEPIDAILLGVTLLLSLTTFGSQKTNFLNGAVHLSLFLMYLFILFA